MLYTYESVWHEENTGQNHPWCQRTLRLAHRSRCSAHIVLIHNRQAQVLYTEGETLQARHSGHCGHTLTLSVSDYGRWTIVFDTTCMSMCCAFSAWCPGAHSGRNSSVATLLCEYINTVLMSCGPLLSGDNRGLSPEALLTQLWASVCDGDPEAGAHRRVCGT